MGLIDSLISITVLYIYIKKRGLRKIRFKNVAMTLEVIKIDLNVSTVEGTQE